MLHRCTTRCTEYLHRHVTKRAYRTGLITLGVLLYVVHCNFPGWEIHVVLLIHGAVTLDPTA